MRVHLTRGRQLATNFITRKKQPPGRHVNPDWGNNHNLSLSYSVRIKQNHPQARNVRHLVQLDHHVFNTVDN